MKNLISPNLTSLALVIALITAAWTLSSIGYFDIAAWMNLSQGYNDAPVLFAAYYGLWSGIVILAFRPDFKDWSARAAPAEDQFAPVLALLIFAIFALKVLPRLPEVDPPEVGVVEDIVLAQPWYFLPKSVEILFQQILLTALVLELQALKVGLTRLMILIATLFGGFHLSLALTDASTFYVLRYTAAATVLGAVFPYLILRGRNGFVWAFGIHWGFYAMDTTIARLVISAHQP